MFVINTRIVTQKTNKTSTAIETKGKDKNC